MPTYEYVCDACEHAFELFQQMSDPVKRKCPKCARPKLRRLVGTGAGVIFRGSGFYETDYRSESYKKGAESERKAGSGEDKTKTDGTKSDGTKSESAKGESAKSESPKSESAAPAKDKKPSRKKKS